MQPNLQQVVWAFLLIASLFGFIATGHSSRLRRFITLGLFIIMSMTALS